MRQKGYGTRSMSVTTKSAAYLIYTLKTKCHISIGFFIIVGDQIQGDYVF